MSHEKRIKLTLAAIVVCWIMALLTYELVADKQAQIAGRVHRVPELFVQMCQWAVGAGLAALSVTTAAGIAAGYRIGVKKREGDEGDDPR